jgi:predicted transcriptional regulator of viral defense system
MMDLKAHAFFGTHPIFHRDEFIEAYTAAGHSRPAALAALNYHCRTRALLNIRRCLYVVEATDFLGFDVCLLPSRLTPLAVLAYDGAAAFHGLAETEYQLCFLAPRSIRYVFSEIIFRGILTPGLDDTVERQLEGDRLVERNGQQICVTSLARTIADCLNHLDRSPPVEHLFNLLLDRTRRLTFDVDEAVRHALKRSSPAGCARLGLLLSSHPQHHTERAHLDALSRRVARHTVYGTQDREPGGFYFRRWHLVMPQPLASQLSND